MIVAVIAVIGVAIGFSRCQTAISEEDYVRITVQSAAQAVREKDLGRFLDHIHPDYHDAAGTSRDSLRALLWREFRARQGIGLVLLPIDVQIASGEAIASFQCAILAESAPMVVPLEMPNTEFWDMTLTLIKHDGVWKITSQEHRTIREPSELFFNFD